jgi:hypothetical protein
MIIVFGNASSTVFVAASETKLQRRSRIEPLAISPVFPAKDQQKLSCK